MQNNLKILQLYLAKCFYLMNYRSVFFGYTVKLGTKSCVLKGPIYACVEGKESERTGYIDDMKHP